MDENSEFAFSLNIQCVCDKSHIKTHAKVYGQYVQIRYTWSYCAIQRTHFGFYYSNELTRGHFQNDSCYICVCLGMWGGGKGRGGGGKLRIIITRSNQNETGAIKFLPA